MTKSQSGAMLRYFKKPKSSSTDQDSGIDKDVRIEDEHRETSKKEKTLRNYIWRYQEESWGTKFFEKVQEGLSKYMDCLLSNVYYPGFTWLSRKKLFESEVDKVLFTVNYITRKIKWLGYVVDWKGYDQEPWLRKFDGWFCRKKCKKISI